MKLRVIQYGMGTIGCNMARAVLAHPAMELVGAVDIHPQKLGMDVGTVLEIPKTWISIRPSLEQAMEGAEADVAIHCTESNLPDVSGQLFELLNARLHVISTCEELSWPWHRYPQLANNFDQAARRVGRIITGAGVNPGFAMDLLPLVLSNTCLGLRSVKAHRIMDAGKRRESLQLKVGAGMEKEGFQAMAREAKIGHAGLIESVAMLGAGLGWKLDEITQEILPMFADKEYITKTIHVLPGQVAGIHQYARGYIEGREVITLCLQIYIGAPASYDKIKLDGFYPIKLLIPGGIPCDDGATSSTISTVLRAVRSGQTGLVAAKDLPASAY